MDSVSLQGRLTSRGLTQVTAFLIPGPTTGLTPSAPASTACSELTSLLGVQNGTNYGASLGELRVTQTIFCVLRLLYKPEY